MAARTTKTAKPAEKTDDTKFNQVVQRTDSDRPFVVSDRFSVANVEVRGRELLAIAPINHVGPAPILVPLAELDELIADLEALRDAPGAADPNTLGADD